MLVATTENKHFRYFTEHLVKLNHVAPITFRQNITIPDGDQVIEKGSCFDQRAATLLAEQDLSYLGFISLTGALDANLLLQDFKQQIESDLALQDFSIAHTDWRELESFIRQVSSSAELMLQLTVLKHQLPLVYAQALFCAWLGLILIKELKRTANDPMNLFKLCLVHDVGLLFLPHDLIKSRKQLNVQQLRLVQSHAALGFTVLKGLNIDMTEDILKAVMEHHENLDGTGYPLGRVGNTISRFGQWLNFLDAVSAIYTKRLKVGQRSLRDIIPMIQMNGHSRFGLLGKKFIQCLKTLPESKTRAVPNVLMPYLIQAVRNRNMYISSCLNIIDKISRDIGFRHGDNRVFALQNAIIHINISITQSGIINSAYMRWLDQVEAEGLVHAYREVEDVYLMMQEVIYHINKLRYQIESFLDAPCDTIESYLLRKGLERLERLTLPKPHPNLEILWIANIH